MSLKEQVYTDPFTEVSIDWCYDHDRDGHDKEGDSHNLYTEAEWHEEGCESDLYWPDIVGAQSAGDEGDHDTDVGQKGKDLGRVVTTGHFRKLQEI